MSRASWLSAPNRALPYPSRNGVRAELRPWAEELLDENRLQQDGFFQERNVRRKWTDHLSGKGDWGRPLWNVLMFQGWLDAQKSQMTSSTPASPVPKQISLRNARRSGTNPNNMNTLTQLVASKVTLQELFNRSTFPNGKPFSKDLLKLDCAYEAERIYGLHPPRNIARFSHRRGSSSESPAGSTAARSRPSPSGHWGQPCYCSFDARKRFISRYFGTKPVDG